MMTICYIPTISIHTAPSFSSYEHKSTKSNNLDCQHNLSPTNTFISHMMLCSFAPVLPLPAVVAMR